MRNSYRIADKTAANETAANTTVETGYTQKESASRYGSRFPFGYYVFWIVYLFTYFARKSGSCSADTQINEFKDPFLCACAVISPFSGLPIE